MKKQLIENLLSQCNIQINGSNPWDIQVKNSKVYDRVLSDYALGLGEAYMDGWWDAQALDQTFHRLLSIDIETLITEKFFKDKVMFNLALKYGWQNIKNRVLNFQTKNKAFEVGEAHYNIGNDLFQLMLDPELNYTCAYWKGAHNLADAQSAKCKLICDKLYLQPGQKILDIGCGWGSFARYAVKNYGVEVEGVTISKAQKALADKLNEGLPIKIHLKDYRDMTGAYDHIVSIGMFEHVGYKNYATFMKIAHRLLKDDGLFLLHTIGANKTNFAANDWIRKYIFPNGMLPSISQMGKAIEPYFIAEDLHNFGAYYDLTLMAWQKHFVLNYEKLKDRYDERFYRMWNYYLLSCAGAFRARSMQLWQWVFSKNGKQGVYHSIR